MSQQMIPIQGPNAYCITRNGAPDLGGIQIDAWVLADRINLEGVSKHGNGVFTSSGFMNLSREDVRALIAGLLQTLEEATKNERITP
jgi:hypothetical protein